MLFYLWDTSLASTLVYFWLAVRHVAALAFATHARAFLVILLRAGVPDFNYVCLLYRLHAGLEFVFGLFFALLVFVGLNVDRYLFTSRRYGR